MNTSSGVGRKPRAKPGRRLAPLSDICCISPRSTGSRSGWGAYNYTFFLLLTWLPSYLLISLRMDLLHSVFYTSVPWLFATAPSCNWRWVVGALYSAGGIRTGSG